MDGYNVVVGKGDSDTVQSTSVWLLRAANSSRESVSARRLGSIPTASNWALLIHDFRLLRMVFLRCEKAAVTI